MVLDVGPGTGTQLPYFAKNHDISAMYGAEPCVELHQELTRRIRNTNLPFEYKIISAGAETTSIVPALAKEGILGDANKGGASTGAFDTIVCVRVLCSVPRGPETVEGLYRLLKPGGKFIVVEHIKNPWRTGYGSLLARILQALYMRMGWPFWIGDCCLDRETTKLLVNAARIDGGWADSDLKTTFGYSTLPYVSGVLTKKA